MFWKKYGFNQNFIEGILVNGDIYSAGRQDRPLPKTFDYFVDTTQLEHINERRNFRWQRLLRVSVSGSIRNQVFSKRVISVPNN